MYTGDLIDQTKTSTSSTGTKGRIMGYNGVIRDVPLTVFAESPLVIPDPSYETGIECDHPNCIVPRPSGTCVPCEHVDAALPLEKEANTSEFGEFVSAPCPVAAPGSVVPPCPVVDTCTVKAYEGEVDWFSLEKCLTDEASARVACMQAEICHNDSHKRSFLSKMTKSLSQVTRSLSQVTRPSLHLSQVTRSLSQVTRPSLSLSLVTRPSLREGGTPSHSKKSSAPLQQFVFAASKIDDFKEFIHQFCSLSKLSVSLTDLFYPPCDYLTHQWCGPSARWDESIQKINSALSDVKVPFKLLGKRNVPQNGAYYKFALILLTNDKLIINQLNRRGIERILVGDNAVSKHRAVML